MRHGSFAWVTGTCVLAALIPLGLVACGGETKREDPYEGLTSQMRLVAMANDDPELSYHEEGGFGYRNSELVVYAADGVSHKDVIEAISAYGSYDANETLERSGVFMLRFDEPMEYEELVALADRIEGEQGDLVDDVVVNEVAAISDESFTGGEDDADGDGGDAPSGGGQS